MKTSFSWTPSSQALTKIAKDVFTHEDPRMGAIDKVQESLDLFRGLRAAWFSGQGDVTPEQALAEHDARMTALAEDLFSPAPLDIEL